MHPALPRALQRRAVAYLIARRFFAVAIYEQLLHQDGLHLPDEQRVATTLSTLLVRDDMTTALRTLPADQSTRDAHQRCRSQCSPWLTLMASCAAWSANRG